MTHDLDKLTENSFPKKHRTLEFAEALGIPGPFPLLRLSKPPRRLALGQQLEGAILFAMEAGHPARTWPLPRARALAERLLGAPLVMIGLRQDPSLPCDVDLRGNVSLAELFDIVSVARCVISMDSGALQVAMALAIPAIAIFGGIDPAHRIFADENVRVLVGRASCRPCNKKETCNGGYWCLSGISVDDVCNALYGLSELRGREILESTQPISN